MLSGRFKKYNGGTVNIAAASQLPILDAGGYYAATDAEAMGQEVGAQLAQKAQLNNPSIINYFNPDTSTDSAYDATADKIVLGKYFNGDSTASAAHYAISGKCFVRKNTTIIVPQSSYISTAYQLGHFLRADGTFVTRVQTAMATKVGSTHWTIAVPDNADIAYFRFTMYNSADDYSQWYCIESSVLPSVAPAYNYGKTNLSSAVLPVKTNPLYGKSIAFEGDSIAAGAGYAGGYGKMIAARNDMTYSNGAVGGATLASGTMSGETPRHWVSTSIASMPSTADYYIIEGGVNDVSIGVTLGSLAADYPVAGGGDTLVTTTVIGALEYACRELVTTFDGKKVGFIFPHGIFATNHAWNTSWRAAMKSALNKWGVPYLDLQEKVPPLNLIASLKSAYTSAADGWHPTKSGYEKFYCDQIEAWLKTL